MLELKNNIPSYCLFIPITQFTYITEDEKKHKIKRRNLAR